MLRCLLVNSLRGFHFRFRIDFSGVPPSAPKITQVVEYWRHADGIDSIV